MVCHLHSQHHFSSNNLGMEVNYLCGFYGISEEDDNPKAALAHYVGLPGDWFPE